MRQLTSVRNHYVLEGEPVNIGWFLFNTDWLSAEELEYICNLKEDEFCYLTKPGGETIKIERVSEDWQPERDEFDRTPMPFDLRPSIRNTCESFDESDRMYILDEEEVSLTFFFEENCDALPANEFYHIFSLDVGESRVYGGGAAGTSTLKRLH